MVASLLAACQRTRPSSTKPAGSPAGSSMIFAALPDLGASASVAPATAAARARRRRRSDSSVARSILRRDEERLVRGGPVRHAACTVLPPVIGNSKRSTAMSRSRPLPMNRSINEAGRRSRLTGGMKAAAAWRQNGLVVNLSRHHLRQRSTVRRSTPTSRRILPSFAPFEPCNGRPRPRLSSSYRRGARHSPRQALPGL